MLACLGAKRQFCILPNDIMALARTGISTTPFTRRQSYEISEDTLGFRRLCCVKAVVCCNNVFHFHYNLPLRGSAS